MLVKCLFILGFATMAAFSQSPPIEPGVLHDLAKWRAARYSDVRYNLNLTLEKMSPVLKGTIEIRVKVEEKRSGGEKETAATGFPIVLDWRTIKGSESLSTISNISVNGTAVKSAGFSPSERDKSRTLNYEESNEHLIFSDGVVTGENVIKLDFTSPILTSGSAITRYVDKEDGAEYIYSLFVPSDASTAFPVFDQPDLKARFQLTTYTPDPWKVVSNTLADYSSEKIGWTASRFDETKPISTYLFAFAIGEFTEFLEGVPDPNPSVKAIMQALYPKEKQKIPEKLSFIYVRKSQAKKFEKEAAQVFRLTREGVKFLEQYFDYKFPFPKYDIVLIPEFPFGGMEHAGATFLRESSVIFPTEPTANDYISRANGIFHETAHQWFGDTVTMKWFDDLWLKEGFAEFMAYKTLEKVMPEYNAWKVFYERNKQAAYQSDSTKGTTAIYQPIDNLSSAKSAYGNIVYRKAPSFLRQAEFYLGPDKFQTAVRSFLRKHEYANAGWEDLVKEFETASGQDLKTWAKQWITQRGLPLYRVVRTHDDVNLYAIEIRPEDTLREGSVWQMKVKTYAVTSDKHGGGSPTALLPVSKFRMEPLQMSELIADGTQTLYYFFPNYQDYGYGIFLLDDKSRDYVLKNIQNEKDDFLRTMMWGSLWDSVREAELDPKDYVELVIKNIPLENDESTIQSLLGRVSTAMNYYLSDAQRAAIAPRLETVLLDRMQHAATSGQRITFYRAFLSTGSTEHARTVLKQMLVQVPVPGTVVTGAVDRKSPDSMADNGKKAPVAAALGTDPLAQLPLRAKDKFDIITRLAILGDTDAPKLLAALEKTETVDDAKRYAYVAHAGFATAENKAKYWNDFLTNKDISESWIEAAMVPFNSIRHTALTQQYLERALAELPNLKRSRKIFFVGGWLGAFIGGQRDEMALAIVNKFLADNPHLDNDLRRKILENIDLIERAVKIRNKYK